MREYWRKIPVKLQKAFIVLSVFVISFICFLAILLGIVLSGSHDQIKGQPEIMIILGCQVMEWGPSQTLADRLDRALEYYQENPDITIIVSGGQGDNEPTTEAFAMANYLIERGVGEEQIYQEGNSRNTHQNLSFSSALLKNEGLSGEVIIVSSGFHLKRAQLLWGRVGGNPETISLLAAPVTNFGVSVQFHIREIFALVKSFLFDQGQVENLATEKL